MLFIHSRVLLFHSSLTILFYFFFSTSRSPQCAVVAVEVAAAMRDAKSERKKDRLLDYILLEFKWLIIAC
jgi:hypothetical protein